MRPEIVAIPPTALFASEAISVSTSLFVVFNYEAAGVELPAHLRLPRWDDTPDSHSGYGVVRVRGTDVHGDWGNLNHCPIPEIDGKEIRGFTHFIHPWVGKMVSEDPDEGAYYSELERGYFEKKPATVQRFFRIPWTAVVGIYPTSGNWNSTRVSDFGKYARSVEEYIVEGLCGGSALWFCERYASSEYGMKEGGWATIVKSPPEFVSPIEQRFFVEFLRHTHYHPPRDLPVPQYNIGRYRADFAFRSSRVIVECDGHDWHEKNREQAARDKLRDRTLVSAGWRVLHFTGSEIFRDVGKCVEETVALL